MRIKATTEMNKRMCVLLETFLVAREEYDLQALRLHRADAALKEAALSLASALAPPKPKLGEVYCAWFSAEVGPNELHDVVLRISRTTINLGNPLFVVETGEGDAARRVHVELPDIAVPG